jgi:hypothetical protein
MEPNNPKPNPPVGAESLRQAMIDAFAALQLAQLKHERAMGVAADAGPLSEDGISSIHQSGRDYAQSVIRYSDAAMAWLAFSDLYVEEARQFARKTETGG